LGLHHLDAAPVALAVAVALFVGASALVWRSIVATYHHPVLGACNIVTQMRLATVAILSAAAVAPDAMTGGFALVALSAAALALDGVDGWLARRQRLSSAFGARFDMEVDAALAAVLAVIALRGDAAGGPLWTASLLVLGFSRYVFVAAALALPRLRAPLPERWSRKAVCVAQIATLVALLLPLPQGVAAPLAAGAAAALLWSFGRDVLRLARAGD
jgi:phosphatidylglycerophosphate synthase